MGTTMGTTHEVGAYVGGKWRADGPGGRLTSIDPARGTPVVTGQSLRWQSCDSAGAGCADIPGAGGDQYVAAATDVGRRLRVVSTADNGIGGPVESASEPTAAIAAAADTRAPRFTLAVSKL